MQNEILTVAQLVVSILVPFTVALVAYSFKKISEIDGRLHEIEASYCTPQSCAAIQKELSELKIRVATLPADGPPKWFVDRFETSIAEIKQKIDAIQARLDRQPLVQT